MFRDVIYLGQLEKKGRFYMSDSTKERSIFSERMQSVRKSKKISLYRLAEKTKIDRSTLGRYESGKIVNVPLENIKIIADALKVNPAYLAGWERAKTKKTLSKVELLVYAIDVNNKVEEFDQKTQAELRDTMDEIMEQFSIKYNKKSIVSGEAVKLFEKWLQYSASDMKKIYRQTRDMLKGMEKFKGEVK